MSDNPQLPLEAKPEVQIVPAVAEAIALRPVMNVSFARQQLTELQAFIAEYLVEDEDYGVIPGTERKDSKGKDISKRCLFKSGAEKLCDVYGMSDEYVLEASVENWDRVPELFDYTYKCILRSRRDQRLLGEGRGSCNSYESKYRWRESKRKCPLCGAEAINKSKFDDGGWYCWAKRGGCGAKFLADDAAITEQKQGREANEDIADLKNTVLKMAKKRAKIDAVIAVTRSSGIFTQDVEETHREEESAGTKESAQRVADKKINEAKAKKVEKPSANGRVDTIFYVIPKGQQQQGIQWSEFLNIPAYLASNQDRQDELRYAFSAVGAKKPKEGEPVRVNTEKLNDLLQVLNGDLGIKVEQLEAR